MKYEDMGMSEMSEVRRRKWHGNEECSYMKYEDMGMSEMSEVRWRKWHGNEECSTFTQREPAPSRERRIDRGD